MEELIPIVAIFFTIGVPVMSLAAHFVLRPMIRDLTGAIKNAKGQQGEDLEHRLTRLEDALLEQNQQLAHLVEAESFRRKLEAGKT